MILFEAHQGVEREAPGNTLIALKYAAEQGYDYFEVDPNFTSDNKIVLLHDSTLDRTALKDGGEIKNVEINKITYAEALSYDVGLKFAPKFAGEKIPLLSEAIALAEKYGAVLKIDNKIQRFPENALEEFFRVITGHEKSVSITCYDIDFIRLVLKRFPDITVHYDGVVNEKTLAQLKETVDKNRLYIWLPIESPRTSWVSVAFADETLTARVKEVAKLGLWITDESEVLSRAIALGADMIETSGGIKKPMNEGCLFDMHTHSHFSHDSSALMNEMQSSEYRHGIVNYAVSDHCDLEFLKTSSVISPIYHSVSEAKSIGALAAVEIGEGILETKAANELCSVLDFDAVLGSVHAVRTGGAITPYSYIDFSSWSDSELYEFLNLYFDDVLETVKICNFDILTHLTCPLRYITGKYGKSIELSRFKNKIDEILHGIIARGIALEVNTSCTGTPYDDFLPNEAIIRRYRELGGYLITLASDAHAPENAARNFDRAVSFLKDAGFENVYYFKNRIPVQCRL